MGTLRPLPQLPAGGPVGQGRPEGTSERSSALATRTRGLAHWHCWQKSREFSKLHCVPCVPELGTSGCPGPQPGALSWSLLREAHENCSVFGPLGDPVSVQLGKLALQKSPEQHTRKEMYIKHQHKNQNQSGKASDPARSGLGENPTSGFFPGYESPRYIYYPGVIIHNIPFTLENVLIWRLSKRSPYL